MTIITRIADYLSSLLAPSYLNHADITRLCQAGAVDGWSPECVNPASLDLRLGKTILIEARRPYGAQPLDYRARSIFLSVRSLNSVKLPASRVNVP